VPFFAKSNLNVHLWYIFHKNKNTTLYYTVSYNLSLRRVRDSNPRKFDLQRFSRPPHSTTLPTLQIFYVAFCVLSPHSTNHSSRRICHVLPTLYALFLRTSRKDNEEFCLCNKIETKYLQ